MIYFQSMPMVCNARFFIVLGLSFLFPLLAIGQLVVSPQKISFGEVTKESLKMVDIIIENRSSKSDILLSSSFGVDFEVKFLSKTVAPNDRMIVRVQFNPRRKGNFSEVAELFFASQKEPILIPISADVRYVNVNGYLPCPDFNQKPADCCSSNLFMVEVYDENTKKPIPGAIVRIEEQGYIQLRLSTNKEGKVSNELRIGFYDLVVSAIDYIPETRTGYINHSNAHFIFYLKKSKAEDSIPAAEVFVQETGEVDSLNVEQILDDGVLPRDQYAANLMVFLLDVSGSMGSGNKLSLLQDGLLDLTNVMRDIDQMGLVSYAGEAKVLLSVSGGNDKEGIKKVVAELKTGGKTSGAKGFKKSYQMLRKHRLKEGNNQLIVITDGAFSVEDQKQVEKEVVKARKKGFVTSILAIKPNTFAIENLSKVAELGGGRVLIVDEYVEASQLLIEEMQNRSRK